MAVEIFDTRSKDFDHVLVYGREFVVVDMRQDYDSPYPTYGSPHYSERGRAYVRVPDVNIRLTLRTVPPPPPPTPKRTWSGAMGLRRPKR